MTMMKLKQEIVKLCNESNLPIEAVLFVLKDVFRDAEEAFTAYEAGKMKKQEKEKIVSEEESNVT